MDSAVSIEELREALDAMEDKALEEALAKMRETGPYTIEDYYALPDERRVELIDGLFYDMAAPSVRHQDIVGNLYYRIFDHIMRSGKGCKVFPAPFDVKLTDDGKNVVEPDIVVICDPGKLDDKRCNGAPDWVIEVVSPGSTDKDYIRKLELYKRAGVREYWIVDPSTEQIYVYNLEGLARVRTYAFTDEIPVGIADDGWVVDFGEIKRGIE